MTDPQARGVVRLGGLSVATVLLTAVVLLVPIGLVLATTFPADVPVRILGLVLSVAYGVVVIVRVVLPLVRETAAVVDLDAGTITFGGHPPVPFADLGFAQLGPGRRTLSVQLGLDRRTVVSVSNAPLIGSTRTQRAAARSVIAGSRLPSGAEAVHPLRDRTRILATMDRFFFGV